MNSAAKIRAWRENPASFVADNFKVDPDRWQLKALSALGDPELSRISMQACAGPGKSAVLAWAGWWFLSTQGERGEHPKAAAVSITSDNLKDNLWAEMSKWQDRSEFLKAAFTWTKERIFANDHASTWFMSARSWSKSANDEEVGRTLSGLHSKYVLYLIDESGDIPPAIVKSAEQGLSTGPKFGKILQAGNPTSEAGVLFAAANQLRHLWYIIRITGDPLDPDRSPRISLAWAEEQIKTYGRDNPWVMSFILGLFPPGGINSLLDSDSVNSALGRGARAQDYTYSQKRLGVDVARFGDDRTVIFPRQGLVAFKPVELRNARTPDIAARVMNAKYKWGSEMEFIDGTGGYGAGVIDAMMQAGQSPLEINFASKAISAKYANRRAEMWFLMAEWVRRGGCLPNMPQLARELTAPTYTFQGGKFLLESKDQIKARLGFSPDLADALCLTFALPDMPGREIEVDGVRIVRPVSQETHQTKHEFDPQDYM